MYHSDYVFDAAISADGRTAITGDWASNSLVRIWTLFGGSAVLRLPHPDTREARFSPDGTHLVTIGETDFAQPWQLPDGKPTFRFRHKPFVGHASFSPDGKLLVTAGWDGMAHIWDVATGDRLATLQHQGRIVDARFSPNGQTVVTAGFEDGVPACRRCRAVANCSACNTRAACARFSWTRTATRLLPEDRRERCAYGICATAGSFVAFPNKAT